MIQGIVFSVLTGCCFALGAGLFATVARRGLPFMLFLSIGATLGLAISLLAIVDWAAFASETRGVQLALWIVPGALANVAGHRAMACSMAGGRSSVAWAIGQGGQAVPFIATVLIWNEHAGAISWLGLALILAGVAVLAQTKGLSVNYAAPAAGDSGRASRITRGAYPQRSVTSGSRRKRPEGRRPSGERRHAANSGVTRPLHISICSLLVPGTWRHGARSGRWRNLRISPKTVATASASATAAPSPTWVYWALAALLCYGMNGTLMSVPSHWVDWHDGAHLRVPITLGVFALAGIACSSRIDLQAIRRLSLLAIPYGSTLAACFACLYRALDALSAAGAAAIAWPLACSTGVVTYALWEHLIQRRPITRKEIAGIATVVAGIVVLAIRTPLLIQKS